MTKTVMAFGDSNTFGRPPATARGGNARFGTDVRWPQVMQRSLGADWHVLEEGLPGRTTCHPDPLKGPHMDGQLGLRIALESHGPIDLLIIMLGTNDCQMHHAASPAQVVAGLARLLAIAGSEEYQERHDGFEIMVVAPPVILEQGIYRELFFGAHAKSKALAPLIADLAAHWNVHFFDAGAHIQSSATDGIHFEAADHVTLGNALAAKVASL